MAGEVMTYTYRDLYRWFLDYKLLITNDRFECTMDHGGGVLNNQGSAALLIRRYYWGRYRC
jgi:hypothetical protein